MYKTYYEPPWFSDRRQSIDVICNDDDDDDYVHTGVLGPNGELIVKVRERVKIGFQCG